MESKNPLSWPKALFRSIFLASVLCLLSGCSSNSKTDRGKVGNPSPEFSVVDIKGKEYSTSTLNGSIIVLNFWFIACPPCIREIPDLNSLVQKYKDKNVVFLALATDSKSKLSKFLEDSKFDYNIVAKSKWMTRKFDTHGFPTNIIIDSSGEIIFHEAAYDSERVVQMDKILSSLVEE